MKTKIKKLYWISFSYEGENQGVCMTESTSKKKAIEKVKAISPKSDDILCLECPVAEISLDRFYTKEEMSDEGYLTTRELELLNKTINKKNIGLC